MRVANKYLLDCQEVRNGKGGRCRLAMTSEKRVSLEVAQKNYRLRFTFGQDELFKKYFATFKIPFHQFTQHWKILEEGKELGIWDYQENDYEKILYNLQRHSILF